jgi:hypothetical protein
MRALITVSVAVLGAAFGFLLGAVVDAIPPGMGVWFGLAVGGVGGYALARQTYPRRPRHPRA